MPYQSAVRRPSIIQRMSGGLQNLTNEVITTYADKLNTSFLWNHRRLESKNIPIRS